ncbi:hypothetical protein GALL_203570 [mine drainage metagenome]|uniref:Uncharacterized protein n=1 Tax=mine drainage metagenome TaxID=410659 RepID=A0A1J5RNH3_9ZZZZ
MTMQEEALKSVMLKEYGPLMGGEDLRRALGYRTWSAFARAVRSGVLAVTIFEIPGRRGKFALTPEVADWLTKLRQERADVAQQIQEGMP